MWRPLRYAVGSAFDSRWGNQSLFDEARSRRGSLSTNLRQIHFILSCRVEGKKSKSFPMKTAMPQLFIVVLIFSLGFLKGAQAVIPPPDGGYPGGNTAEG